MRDDPTDLSDLIHPPHQRAEIVFAVASFLAAGILALFWSSQTTWIDGQPLVRQPGLWPLIAILGMLLFGLGELIACLRRNARNRGSSVTAELMLWAKAFEYVVWFLAYVMATPWIGYLPASMIFTTALAFRLGYRGRLLALSPLVGVGIVLVFKTFLDVRMPGGAVYDLLPHDLRNFLVLYF
ncbi:tripartite tricarboxylate transporter TctB family protein [Pararhodobacter zhoushanensis]|jgi:hypothetical protein|uniref:Tripartite tricarboxylate transporter TctB family protein n=1 Tax=Pararhodobacter zhoushanensis TaxID=2479545 RepID=A0ABT3H4K6_9RHOB|nr:tripartite tricarboxylate transporter TctB family protein [Pararhodobacter zhoushanensis]MCW1934752.1 tripartite tricarboxylate transporter TctB family protein [Pararhodobacter zhoushanensis]